MNTIFALATAQGRSGVSVIRVSGTDAFAIAKDISGALPAPRFGALRILRDPLGQVLDQALVICFPAPASFTGEDVVEFQVHGSIAVVRAVLSTLSDDPRARIADPGEFTRRALENEKLDLPQVEGLADLIDAETEAQRKQAITVLSGALGEKVEQWRADLIRAAALLEATIDFADEDVPVDVSLEVSHLLESVEEDLQKQIEGSFVAERIRNGFEVALVGPPNSGKSTLLNRLAGREAAITSEFAGTTRDIIEVRMDLGGLPVTFLDTAGVRESIDPVEIIGIGRAIERARNADLRVFLLRPEEDFPFEAGKDDIRLSPKVDISGDLENGISGKTGTGVSNLISTIQKKLQDKAGDAGLAAHERHRTAMVSALNYLLAAQNILKEGPDFYEIASEEIRGSIRLLERFIGRIDVENLLDEIFSSFCVGK